MISYRGTTGGSKFTALSAADEMGKIAKEQDKAFRTITSGMNSLGASMNGIALQVEAMTQAMKDRVSSKIRGDAIVKKQEVAADKQEADREKKKTNAERLQELKKKRALFYLTGIFLHQKVILTLKRYLKYSNLI